MYVGDPTALQLAKLLVFIKEMNGYPFISNESALRLHDLQDIQDCIEKQIQASIYDPDALEEIQTKFQQIEKQFFSRMGHDATRLGAEFVKKESFFLQQHQNYVIDLQKFLFQQPDSKNHLVRKMERLQNQLKDPMLDQRDRKLLVKYLVCLYHSHEYDPKNRKEIGLPDNHEKLRFWDELSPSDQQSFEKHLEKLKAGYEVKKSFLQKEKKRLADRYHSSFQSWRQMSYYYGHRGLAFDIEIRNIMNAHLQSAPEPIKKTATYHELLVSFEQKKMMTSVIVDCFLSLQFWLKCCQAQMSYLFRPKWAATILYTDRLMKLHEESQQVLHRMMKR